MRKKRPNYLRQDDAPMILSVIEIFKSCDGMAPAEVELRIDGFRKASRSDTRINYLKKILFSRCKPKTDEDQVKPMQLRADFSLQWFAQEHFPLQSEPIWQSFVSASGMKTVDQVKKAMFADVDEKIDASQLDPDADLATIIADTNLLMIFTHLRHALSVRIYLEGNARSIVRLAKFRGLFCFVTTDEDDHFYLDISGAMALFKKTARYASMLMEILRLLCWTDDFKLEAYCERKEKLHTLVVKSTDPIKPGKRPRLFDSKVEERFAREVLRKCPEWELVREPDAIDTDVGVMFPDFLLCHKFNKKKLFYCEIVGYWTPEYLRKKMAQWSTYDQGEYILCVDEKLKIEGESVSDYMNSRIIFYKAGKIDPLKVIEAYDHNLSSYDGNVVFAARSRGAASHKE